MAKPTRTPSVDDDVNENAKISSFRMSVILFVTLLIDLLGFTVILPLMPRLLEYYGTQGSDDLYIAMQKSVSGFRDLVGAPDTPKWNSVLFAGCIGSLFSFLQFLASPFIGAASDRYGRKPLLLLTMAGVAFSYALWAVSTTFTWFVISRVIGGVAKGNIGIGTAIVADIYPEGQRGKGMAIIGVAFSLGFLLGPLIGAGFASRSELAFSNGLFFVAPALFSLFMAVLDIVYIYCAFQETLPQSKKSTSVTDRTASTLSLINPVSLFRFSAVSGASDEDAKSMRQIGLVYFIYLFLYSGLEFTLTFLTFHRFNYTSMQQGRMFFIIGTVMIVIQGSYTRRQPGGTERRSALTGLVLLIPAFILIGMFSHVVVFYTGLIMFAFASATVVPSMTTLISSYGTERQKGAVMGVFRALGALARSVGPIMACAAYWSLGAERCYLIGSILLIIPLLGMLGIRAKVSTKTE